MDYTDIVKKHYDENPQEEWERIADRPEFLLTKRFIDRYVKSDDKVIDIGGGPGRYSIYLAKKGCDVTLFDLSSGNIEFAKNKSADFDVNIKTVCGDARFADSLVSESGFDCVLLMGPLYHLLTEEDREKAVRSALKLLKPGGMIFVSFISIYGGLVFMTKLAPEIVISQVPLEITFRETLYGDKDYAGDAFTKAFFIQPKNVLPFMARFPIEKMHLIGQEGVMTLNEDRIFSCSPEVINGMIDFSERVCENPELLSWSEHLLYIGRKNK